MTLDESNADTLKRIMGTDFTHSGTLTHSYDSATEAAFTTRGTYDGAPGLYRCEDVSGTDRCRSTNDGKGSPTALGGVWHFKPDGGANAMAHQPDANYLYYGWWVSKDKDGDPTAASVFTGVHGAIAVPTSGTDSPEDLTGTATYEGHAAGKFAVSNPLDGTGNGGHFTADATLTAKFGAITAPNNGGISGTVNNFRLNDGRTIRAGVWRYTGLRGALLALSPPLLLTTRPLRPTKGWARRGRSATARRRTVRHLERSDVRRTAWSHR